MSTRVPVGTYGRRARLAARFSTLFRSRCTAVPVLVYRTFMLVQSRRVGTLQYQYVTRYILLYLYILYTMARFSAL